MAIDVEKLRRLRLELERTTPGDPDRNGAFKRYTEAMAKAMPELLDWVEKATAALEVTAEHVVELEEAWRRGVLMEPRWDGGTRSNRNVTVRVAVYDALNSLEATRNG